MCLHVLCMALLCLSGPCCCSCPHMCVNHTFAFDAVAVRWLVDLLILNCSYVLPWRVFFPLKGEFGKEREREREREKEGRDKKRQIKFLFELVPGDVCFAVLMLPCPSLGFHTTYAQRRVCQLWGEWLFQPDELPTLPSMPTWSGAVHGESEHNTASACSMSHTMPTDAKKQVVYTPRSRPAVLHDSGVLNVLKRACVCEWVCMCRRDWKW